MPLDKTLGWWALVALVASVAIWVFGGLGMELLGYPLWITGCVLFALAKERHWAWGLLGLLFVLGLLVLLVLPTRETKGDPVELLRRLR